MSLTKLALDAMKLRQFARDTGIKPHHESQWKWAVRQMRGGRGELLPQAEQQRIQQQRLGRLAPELRHELQVMHDATGGMNEVGIALGAPKIMGNRHDIRNTARKQWEQDRQTAYQEHVNEHGSGEGFVWNKKLSPYANALRATYQDNWLARHLEKAVDHEPIESVMEDVKRWASQNNHAIEDMAIGKRRSIGDAGSVSSAKMSAANEHVGFAHTHPADSAHEFENRLQRIEQWEQRLQTELSPEDRAIILRNLREFKRGLDPVLVASPSGTYHRNPNFEDDVWEFANNRFGDVLNKQNDRNHALGPKLFSGADASGIERRPYLSHPIMAPDARVDAAHKLFGDLQGNHDNYRRTLRRYLNAIKKGVVARELRDPLTKQLNQLHGPAFSDELKQAFQQSLAKGQNVYDAHPTEKETLSALLEKMMYQNRDDYVARTKKLAKKPNHIRSVYYDSSVN